MPAGYQLAQLPLPASATAAGGVAAEVVQSQSAVERGAAPGGGVPNSRTTVYDYSVCSPNPRHCRRFARDAQHHHHLHALLVVGVAPISARSEHVSIQAVDPSSWLTGPSQGPIAARKGLLALITCARAWRPGAVAITCASTALVPPARSFIFTHCLPSAPGSSSLEHRGERRSRRPPAPEGQQRQEPWCPSR